MDDMSIFIGAAVLVAGALVMHVMSNIRIKVERSNHIPIEEVKGFEFLKDIDPSTVKEWVYIDGRVEEDGVVKHFHGRVPKVPEIEGIVGVLNAMNYLEKKDTPETRAFIQDLNARYERKELTDEEMDALITEFAERLKSKENE